MLTMSLKSKFSKVEKNFLGQCDCLAWHKFPSKSQFFSNFSFFYNMKCLSLLQEIPLATTTSLKNTLKENGGLSKPTKTKRQKEHFCVSNGCISSFLVFLENTSFHIEKQAWKTTALRSLLSYLSDTMMGKRIGATVSLQQKQGTMKVSPILGILRGKCGYFMR